MMIVMGLPGAGKSTVLAIAKEAGWTVLNYGDMMMEIAKSKGIADRDQLRKQPAEFQKDIQRQVGEKLTKEKRRNVILDTHCSISTSGGYLPGLPFAFLQKWQVERLVLLTAPIKDILARRKNDTSRVRDEESGDSLAEHDMMNRSYLASYSALTGAPAMILVNANGKLEEVQASFRKLLA